MAAKTGEIAVRGALTRFGAALTKRVPSARPGVHTLVIDQAFMADGEGTWFDTHDHLSDHGVCDRVWTRLPDLRRLVVESGWDIFERVDHDTIEEIVIREGAPFCTLRGHAKPWRAPALRSIAWHYRCDCTATGAEVNVEDFEPIWTADAPALREIDLSKSNLYVRAKEKELLDVAGFRKLLPRLEVLRLPFHAVGRTPGVLREAIEKHAARLAHLQAFELTRLSGADARDLRRLVPGFRWL